MEGATLSAGTGGGLPRHVAIIMDGNGRWAARRGLPRVAGHRAGAEAVRQALKSAVKTGVEVLTLYAFSSENWRRSEEEVSDLKGLLGFYLERELDELARDRDATRDAGLLARDEGQPGEQVRGAQRGRLVAAQELLEAVVGREHGERGRVVTARRRQG